MIGWLGPSRCSIVCILGVECAQNSSTGPTHMGETHAASSRMEERLTGFDHGEDISILMIGDD